MTKLFSVYLDFVRFFAAVLVFFFHSKSLYSPDSVFFIFGHEAVAIFFVLSGYVIAYVADNKEKTLKDYAISRMARIFSVAIPAIVLTVLFDTIGQSINLDAYPEGYRATDLPLVRIVSSLLFVNQIWSMAIQFFSNVPYWSLNYEVWYYVGFGLIFYIGGTKGKLLFAGLLILLGPKLLLLMPLWWLGVFIYRSDWHATMSLLTAYALVALSLLGIALYVHFNIDQKGDVLLKQLIGAHWFRQLSFSRHIFSDYPFALMIAMNFVGVRALANHYNSIPKLIEAPIRYLAASTFTLYLIHQPLLLLFHACFYQPELSLGQYVMIMGLTLISVFFIAYFTEQKKHVWKRWVIVVYEWVSQRLATTFALNR